MNEEAKVVKILETPLKEKGYDIASLRFVSGQEPRLEIVVDRVEPIGLDDIVELSGFVSNLLDEADPIEQSYNLQVQSPGIDRELTRDFHFERYMGEKIMIRLIKAFEGKRDYKGVLTAFDDESVTIALDEETELNVNKKEASWIKADDFGGFEENE